MNKKDNKQKQTVIQNEQQSNNDLAKLICERLHIILQEKFLNR